MTNPLLSQDGGDGEHAAITVSEGIRTVMQDPNYLPWGLAEFAEIAATEDEVRFAFKAGDTEFFLTLTKSEE